MKINWSKVIVNSFKIVTAVTSAVAVFFGIGKLMGSDEDSGVCSTGEEDTPSNYEDYKDSENSNGVSEFDNSDYADDFAVDHQPQRKTKLQRIVGGIKAAQVVCTNIVNVISSLTGVAKSFDNLFNKEQYQRVINQTNYIQPGQCLPEGNYPWNPEPDYVPYDQPVNVGLNPANDQNVYIVKRPKEIQVW